jgi:hypothetical protein
MTNSPLICRSQLLLQYLTAGDLEVASNDLVERSLDLAEARAAAADSECLA